MVVSHIDYKREMVKWLWQCFIDSLFVFPQKKSKNKQLLSAASFVKRDP